MFEHTVQIPSLLVVSQFILTLNKNELFLSTLSKFPACSLFPFFDQTNKNSFCFSRRHARRRLASAPMVGSGVVF